MTKKKSGDIILVLLARSINRRVVVLATNHIDVDYMCEACSSDAEEIGLLSKSECEGLGSGLYVWEGISRVVYYGLEQEPDLIFEGKVREARIEELNDLFNMIPPENVIDGDFDHSKIQNDYEEDK